MTIKRETPRYHGRFAMTAERIRNGNFEPLRNAIDSNASDLSQFNADGERITLVGDRVFSESAHVERIVPRVHKTTCIRCRRSLDSARHQYRCTS